MHANETRHAILSNDRLIYSIEQSTGKRQLCHLTLGSEIDFTSVIPTVLTFCIEHSINTLWVVPGCKWGITPTVAVTGLTSGTWDIHHTTARPKDSPPDALCLKQVTARRKSGTWQERRQIVITWPEYTSYAWRPEILPEVTDAISCLAAIHYLELAYKMPLHHNAGIMGRNIMAITNSTGSRPGWIQKPSFDPERLPKYVGFDLTYNSGRLEGDHIHAFDKNSAYLAACSHIELGTGNPVYLGPYELQNYDTTLKKWYDGRRPGYWHIAYRQEDLPTFNPLKGGQEWVTTPLLRLLYVIGFKFTITEAWVWPEYHRILDRFAGVIWDARQEHKTDFVKYPHTGGRVIAYYSDKRIATSAVGMLGNEQARELAPEWGRKDWLDEIIERNKEAVYMKALQVYRLHGKMPLAIATDAIFYASGQRNADLLFPHLFGNPEQLGGWKLLYSMPVTPEIAGCFVPGVPGATANRRLKQLLKAGSDQ